MTIEEISTQEALDLAEDYAYGGSEECRIIRALSAEVYRLRNAAMKDRDAVAGIGVGVVLVAVSLILIVIGLCLRYPWWECVQ